MRFKELRRRRRRPQAPMFLLDLDLPFEEVMADLVFPWGDPAAVDQRPAVVNRAV